MTTAELAESVQRDTAPGGSLSDEAKALWHVKKGNWKAAHNIAQEIHTPMGSWIHALLHLIDGDQGNANYWFRLAGRPARKPADIENLWNEIASELQAS